MSGNFAQIYGRRCKHKIKDNRLFEASYPDEEREYIKEIEAIFYKLATMVKKRNGALILTAVHKNGTIIHGHEGSIHSIPNIGNSSKESG